MLIHNVFFWLKPGLSEEETLRFVEGAQSLLTIESVSSGYVGKPASTESRPIIDRSYDYALLVAFENVAAHDAYQDHPVHDKFRELAHLWSRVQIYDVESLFEIG